MWWRTPWLRQRWWLVGLALLDAVLLALVYNLLFWWQFRQWVGISTAVLALMLLWGSSSYLLGRYSYPEQGQRDSRRRRLQSTGLVALLVLATIVVVFNWGIKVRDPRTFRSFLIPLLGSVTLLSGLAQLWVCRLGQRARHWLLVGTGEELAVLRRELGAAAAALPLLFCDPQELGEQALPGDGEVEAIAVSEAAWLEDGQLQALLARRGSGMSICSLVLWAELHLQRVPPELFSSRWLVQAEGFELQPERFGWRLKRLGDVFVAGLLLLLSLPLLGLAALLVHLEDGGPVFYGQVRTGLFGEPIRMFKLRSMGVDAEANGIRWASAGDARITRVGRWLRRLRIDELPQLLSVIRGEMSLIGPRPERPDMEQELDQVIPNYRVRHWIRPGLSGWAQVCHPYGASVADSRQKLSYDLYYLRNASLPLDLLILFKTMRLVMGGQGSEPKRISPTMTSPHQSSTCR